CENAFWRKGGDTLARPPRLSCARVRSQWLLDVVRDCQLLASECLDAGPTLVHDVLEAELHKVAARYPAKSAIEQLVFNGLLYRAMLSSHTIARVHEATETHAQDHVALVAEAVLEREFNRPLTLAKISETL